MERPLFSEILASRRRELGYSIGQASRVLRLKEDVLIAFEEGDFESMPKSGYAQGMLASYARYLGLDATEICDIYIEDLDSYRHGRTSQNGMRRGSKSASSSRSQSPSIGQPYVAKRGLLPTSGGMAGDLGSFATTRVRSRDQLIDDRDDFEEGTESLHVEYPQGRPYTGRRPTRMGRERTGGRRTRGRGDIDTMSPNDYEYEDDLRFGRDVRSYEAASTGRGRRRSRRNGDRQRPSVRRQARTGAGSSSSRRDGRRGGRGNGSGRRSRRGSQQPRPNRTLILVIAAVAILSVIIVLTAVSCIRQGSDETRTVPVSSVESNSQNNSQTSSESTQDNKSQTNDKEGNSEQSSSTGSSAHTGGSSNSSNSANTGKNNSAEKETSVSVSVNDGEVTWLEIECDGKSDVAETITGPWQKTYTVTDSMTIQAGETSSVAVVQNGRQLQFESITAGIGTLRIQGTKKTEKSSDAKAENNTNSSNNAESAGAAKSGSASGTSDEGGSNGSATSSDYTTIDGVTYDVYGNVVSNEAGTTSADSTSNANASGSYGSSTKTSAARSSGR